MAIYLQLDGHGAIIGLAGTPQEDAGWIACAHDPVPEKWSYMTYDPADGFALRPELDDPVTTPTGIAWADLPEGTVIYVTDAAENVPLGTLRVGSDGDATFDLPEAGQYLFDLSPPSPFMPMLWRQDVP